MFDALLSELDGCTDLELDERLRANEAASRRLQAERAALVGTIERRGAFAAEHPSMACYLRATLHVSDSTASRERRLGRLVLQHPEVGAAVMAGHIGTDHATQIVRVHANPRITHLVGTVIAPLLDLAEHRSHREFTDRITQLIARLDDDGAFDDLREAVESRSARVVEAGGQAFVSAHGGDPVQAAQLQAVFDAFVEAEYRLDVTERRRRHGDDADRHPLDRTHGQRRFDALVAIFAAAHGATGRGRLPDTVVNIIVDASTVHEALTHAGIVLPNGNTIELGESGHALDPLLDDLAAQLATDPAAFIARRCETPGGSAIHPTVLLRSLLTGYVRRTVVDSRSVVIDHGTRQRLFTGLARQAALLLSRTCVFPGCTRPAERAQVDHNHEHHEGGATDQDNANVACGHHNRVKHRQRWRTRRDPNGRSYTVRADGTTILPVGERPPDLSVDELTRLARRRLAAIR